MCFTRPCITSVIEVADPHGRDQFRYKSNLLYVNRDKINLLAIKNITSAINYFVLYIAG